METLACLLDGNVDREECVISSWDPVGHIETTGASWTGARMGDANVNKGREYTASEKQLRSSSDALRTPSAKESILHMAWEQEEWLKSLDP